GAGRARPALRIRSRATDRALPVLGGAARPAGHLIAEPGELPTGILARRSGNPLDRLCLGDPPPEQVEDLADADRFHRRHVRRDRERRQRPHCLDGALVQHPRRALRNTAMEQVAVGIEDDTLCNGHQRYPRCLVPFAERAAGRAEDLHRPDNAGTVGRADGGCVSRSDRRERGVERRSVACPRPDPDALAYVGRDRRDGGETFGQRLEVEPGSADEDRGPASPPGLVERSAGLGEPCAGRVARCRGYVPVEPVRNPRLVFEGRPRGQHAQLAVDLHRIGVDDDAAALCREFQRQPRLAAGSRPGYQHHRRFRLSHRPSVRSIPLTLIRPFRALRPAPGRAAEVLAPPYDVLSSAEARERANGNPWNFLHVSKAADNLRAMSAAGVLMRDAKPCYYVYRLTWRGRTQTGLAAAASLEAYAANRIRKHELTTPAKEDDRVRQI